MQKWMTNIDLYTLINIKNDMYLNWKSTDNIHITNR